MSRQVDIKALVSHIVRGDGADKCRICLGDTTEGQVYLGDTVMMDGERPVSLSELLETITGVEVALEEYLPPYVCAACHDDVIRTATFRDLCKKAHHTWHSTVELLKLMPHVDALKDKKAIYAILQDNQIMLVKLESDDEKDKSEKPVKVKSVKLRDKIALSQNREIRTRNKRQKLKKCLCPDCGKSFSFAQDFYDHLRDSTDFKRSCFICAAIMTRDELVDHLKQEHKRHPFDCKKCPGVFQSAEHLKKHITKEHAPGTHLCGECGRSFSSMYAYHGHISMHNTKNCPSCDKLFRNHRCFLHHIKTCCKADGEPHRTKNKVLYTVNSVNDKKVKIGARGSVDTTCYCDYCGNKFAGKRFVSAHIQIVHMKNTHRPCSYCGQMVAAAYFQTHLKKHEEVKTLHTCQHCGITLKTKLGYTQHLRLHTGEKPYACQHCGERFSAASRRSEHIRNAHKTIKQADLKHACDFCPARFRLPYKLRHHIATVHNNEEKKLDFECPDCHIKFGSCRGLIHHSRTHQTFSLKSLLKEEKKKLAANKES